jgi:hypothetical protein
MSIVDDAKKLRLNVALAIALALFTSLHPAISMENELFEDGHIQGIETIVQRPNPHTTEELTINENENFLDNLNGVPQENPLSFITRNSHKVLWGVFAYSVVTNPKFSSFCQSIFPYIPVVGCLVAGGLYFYIPYAQKCKKEREEQDARDHEQIRQRIQAQSDALEARIKTEIREELRRFRER